MGDAATKMEVYSDSEHCKCSDESEEDQYLVSYLILQDYLNWYFDLCDTI